MKSPQKFHVSQSLDRRGAMMNSGAFLGAFFGASGPALALRSVLDEASQELFDEKEAKRRAPPPPPKTLQETLGLEGTAGDGKEATFARPKFERKAQREAREAAEKAAAEIGYRKEETSKPKKAPTAEQIQAQKEADEAAERAAAALARRRAAGLN